jgi:hypothetical protein
MKLLYYHFNKNEKILQFQIILNLCENLIYYIIKWT